MGPRPLFGTNGIRFIPGSSHGLDFVVEIAQAIGTHFGKGPALIGHDGRSTGPVLSKAVSAGLMAAGTNVVECGLVPTPALQYSIGRMESSGGVMITASHNPAEYNGIKVIDADGVEIDRGTERVIEEAHFSRDVRVADWKSVGEPTTDSRVISAYCQAILSRVERRRIMRRKYKVVVDPGNGVQSLAAPTILEELGCKVVTLNGHVDGNFSGRGPEPTTESLTGLAATVVSTKADLGIAYDGDGDRSIFCDNRGIIHPGDKTGALIVDFILSRRLKSLIVTPVSTSQLIEIIASEHRAKVLRTRVGSVDVSRTMLKRKAQLGLEENGGFFYGPHQAVRDGAMTSALLLEALATKNASLSNLLHKYPNLHQKKLKFQCPRYKVQEVMTAVGKHSNGIVEKMDGLKFWTGKRTWILTRPSGTEPLIRVFAESDTEKRLQQAVENISNVIENVLRGQ